jgi:hypothetical protein
MTVPVKSEILEYFGKHWTRNKAVGALAELLFQTEVVHRYQLERKIVEGCWIFTPPVADFYARREAFFLHRIDREEGTPLASLAVPPPVVQASQYLRRLGIRSFYAIPDTDTALPFEWKAVDLSSEAIGAPQAISSFMKDFPARMGKRVVRGGADVSAFANLQDDALLGALTKESFADACMTKWKISAVDVDYFLFGRREILPIEIKEKDPAPDKIMGRYFGLDVGPFIKLSYFFKAGETVYVVREIDNKVQRNLRYWKYLKFTDILDKSDWVGLPGGPPMVGKHSFTVRIPYEAFRDLTREELLEM